MKYIKCIVPAILLVGVTACTFEKARMSSRGEKIPHAAFHAPVNKAGQTELIRSDYAKGEVENLCNQGLQSLRTDLDTKVTNAIDFDQRLADFGDEVGPLTFMGYVSENAEMRDEASACEEKFNQILVEIFTRRDLYEKVKNTAAANAEQARLISELRRSFEMNGMALSEEKLQQFIVLKKELASLEAKFSKNLNEDKSTILVSASELEGVSADFLGRLQKSKEGQYIVTTKSTDFTQVMENAVNPETRKKMNAAYDGRAGVENSKLLSQAVALRHQIAGLTGFQTWADYRINGRMAKNGSTALNLLNDLKERLKPRLKKDLDLLLAAKMAEMPKAEQELKSWDVRYYANQVKKRDYSLDDEVLRNYFPKDVVMKGVFEVYSSLFGVDFEEVQNASVWSKLVKLYAIRDSETKNVIAYFYADFAPREGKYGHAAAFPLISGRVMADGKYSLPVASIVANFTPPTESKPSLLTFDEVETLFHEFGHIMHQTLTRAPFASLSGSSVAQDFVEAPSQMLENWVYDREILKLITAHYESGEDLPEDLIQKLIAGRDFNIGYHYSRQITLGLTDLTLHTSSAVADVNETYRQVSNDVLGIAPIEGSQWMAGFGHMMGGYDAGYYGYIWSEVYAADMFTAFQANGLLDSVTGRAYRNQILEGGNMREPLEILTSFLGREPNNEAFLKKLGL